MHPSARFSGPVFVGVVLAASWAELSCSSSANPPSDGDRSTGGAMDQDAAVSAAGAGVGGSAGTGGEVAGSAGSAGMTLGSAGGAGSSGSNIPSEGGVVSGNGPSIGGCALFSADDPWQKDISSAATDPAWTAALFANATKKNLHPDFGNSGTDVYGIPINVVPSGQAKLPISFDYADESDPGPYPFPGPDSVKIEGGTAASCDGDCHVLVVQSGACRLYEGWNCHYQNGWQCGSGATFDLQRSSYGQRPKGYTSADAAGLAITPGLVRFSEVLAGVVRHAIRFTMHCTQDGYIEPGSHFAVPTGSGGCPAKMAQESDSDYHTRLRTALYPPMGLRIRLKSSYSIASLPQQTKVIAQAMMTYGMILADNGSDYYFQGDVDPGWNDQLDALKNIPGDAFEVVSPGTIQH